MSLNLFTPENEYQPGTHTAYPAGQSVATPVRINRMSSLHYSHVQEIQRERLRQADSYRLHRLALRARRAVASQIVR